MSPHDDWSDPADVLDALHRMALSGSPSQREHIVMLLRYVSFLEREVRTFYRLIDVMVTTEDTAQAHAPVMLAAVDPNLRVRRYMAALPTFGAGQWHEMHACAQSLARFVWRDIGGDADDIALAVDTWNHRNGQLLSLSQRTHIVAGALALPRHLHAVA